MSEQLLLFIFIPTLCILLSGLVAGFFKPSDQLSSITQHFAAGVVFAAVAKELVVKLGAQHNLYSLIIGFITGISTILLAKFISEKLEQKGNQFALGFIVSIFIDVFIDGLLIGIAFLAGEKGGVLITIALSIELTFLGLVTSATLNNKTISKWVQLCLIVFLAFTVPLAAFLGLTLFRHISPLFMNGVVAFGTSALLYLVTEELLVEAHEVKEKLWTPIFFLAGFLLILILEN